MSESSLLQLIRRHPVALGFSVALHVILLLILAVGLTHTAPPSAPKNPEHKTVQAVVVDAGKVAAEMKKLKQAEEQKKQQETERKQQLQREMDKAREEREQEEKRLVELKKKQQQAEKEEKARQKKLEDEREQKQQELAKLKKQQQELEKKRQEEQQRVAALEQKRKAEEEAEKKRKQAAEAEAARKQEEAEMQRRMEEEQQRRAANDSRLQSLRAQYIAQIQQHVQRQWLQPAQMMAGWQCEVRVQQNILGDVLSVQIVNCNGSEAFRNSVEQAVMKASPLPTPKDPDVFDKTLRFVFRPKA